MKQIPDFTANLSIPTIDEKAWRATEPHTPNPYARVEAVSELNRAGIPTGVLIARPCSRASMTSPEQVARIVELCMEAGAVSIGGIALHLRGSVKQLWFEWLEEHPAGPHPSLREAVCARRVRAAGRAGPAVGAREDRLPARAAGAAGPGEGRRPSPSLNRSPSRPRCSERDYAPRADARLGGPHKYGARGRPPAADRAARAAGPRGGDHGPAPVAHRRAPGRLGPPLHGHRRVRRGNQARQGAGGGLADPRGWCASDGAEASATGSGTPRSTCRPAAGCCGSPTARCSITSGRRPSTT